MGHRVGMQAVGPTLGFQSIRLVSEPERKVQTSGFSEKSGKIEPPSLLLQSDSACTQQGFSEGDVLLASGPGRNPEVCGNLLRASQGRKLEGHA